MVKFRRFNFGVHDRFPSRARGHALFNRVVILPERIIPSAGTHCFFVRPFRQSLRIKVILRE